MATIEETARAISKARADAIEEACEKALQGGECGVLVVRCVDHWHIGPHPSVPYGTIHEYPHGAPVDLVDEMHRG